MDRTSGNRYFCCASEKSGEIKKESNKADVTKQYLTMGGQSFLVMVPRHCACPGERLPFLIGNDIHLALISEPHVSDKRTHTVESQGAAAIGRYLAPYHSAAGNTKRKNVPLEDGSRGMAR